MKTFEKMAAQGDMLITKIDKLPEGLIKQKNDGDHVITHSETGHNHVMSSSTVDLYNSANDAFIAFIVVKEPTELRHLRGFDTHEPVKVDKGIFRINRQREYTPEGFRRAID